jgi:hypothetical protein
MRNRRNLILVFSALLLLVSAPPGLRADTNVTLNALDSGWYKPDGSHDSDNDNYIAGKVGAAGELRNFFVFDLSTIRGPIKSATLRIFHPGSGYNSVDPQETYTTFDVSTAIAELMATNVMRTDIHADLGSGSTYGSVQVTDPSNNVVVELNLNGVGLATLNSAQGLVAIGGALTSLRGQDDEYIFGGSDGSSLRQLVLTVGPPLLISEFRFSGPQGVSDEFVELYNNDFAPLTVSTGDGSSGWALVSADGMIRFTVPNGTTIPQRGHYLISNNSASGYSLGDYGGSMAASPDGNYTGDIPADAGLALFDSANPANFTMAHRLDAVGFSGVADPLYREGAGLVPAAGITTFPQFSFVRWLTSGTPQDTNDNASDFMNVATDQSQGAKLGAPGPENLASPVQRNATVKASFIDPNCAGNGVATSACARVRDFTPAINGTNGTLLIRRRFRNSTGAPLTRLRFRVVDMTTGAAPVGTADLRLLTSTDTPAATLVGGGTVSISGLILEEPPGQTSGGGLNATVSAGAINLAAPLAPGASINVQFLLGVEQGGTFRLFFNIEALPGGAAKPQETDEVARVKKAKKK